MVFAIIFVAVGSLAFTHYKPVVLFENNYRFGSMVFGGGNVLIPMMYEQFVQFKRTIAISNTDFMTGVGLVQAVPGPVFSFATYISAMGMRPEGWVMQIVGALVGTLGIFLPGLLIIFFVYPLWHQFKNHPVIRKSLEGINATAAGLVASAAILLFMQVDMQPAEYAHYRNYCTHITIYPYTCSVTCSMQYCARLCYLSLTAAHF